MRYGKITAIVIKGPTTREEEVAQWLFNVADIEMEMPEEIQSTGVVSATGHSRICEIAMGISRKVEIAKYRRHGVCGSR